jgi:hypothetical protein
MAPAPPFARRQREGDVVDARRRQQVLSGRSGEHERRKEPPRRGVCGPTAAGEQLLAPHVATGLQHREGTGRIRGARAGDRALRERDWPCVRAADACGGNHSRHDRDHDESERRARPRYSRPVHHLNASMSPPPRRDIRRSTERVGDPEVHARAGAETPAGRVVDRTEEGSELDVRGNLIAFLRGPNAAPTSASFGPDGRRFLTSSLDGTVRTYDCRVCGPIPSLVALARARLAATAPR